ncbi:DUF4245 domain-containing protein [Propioniciclava coleopterorum]|uniref:DUF4245 domain-containing protein n=1 Tax=Propioniciclava coleopterorum TaxID=2714937 RepID=A0A6G7Y3T9_9ACTN|nr:DUF4245 domain-containing protein [Propioniciclava coleopterorum]QIK71554.1 DUF4245 domain-containing protein [Propioniciclava coleopterorum]
MARPQRNSTVIQMIVAMAVLMVPILLVVAFFTRTPEAPIQPIDYQPVARQAAAEASYPVLVPQNLPDGWVATRARWTAEGRPGLNGEPAAGDTWQLGMLTPGQIYIGLDQRDASQELFVQQVTRDGRPDGDSNVAGVAWQRYVSEDDRTRSLVLRGDAVTIVSGDLAYEALEAFASSLAPAQP